QGQDRPAPRPQWEQFQPKPLTFFASLMPGSAKRFQNAVQSARQVFDAKHAEWVVYEQKRTAWVAEARLLWEAECKRLRQDADAQGAEVDAFGAAYYAGDLDAINQYFGIVLE